MKGYQKTIIAGNLGQDPELKSTAGGTDVCNLSVAVNESWKNRDGEQQEKTTWFRCVAFGKVALILSEYLSKGDAVMFEGRIQTSQYEDRDGNTRYSWDLAIDEFRFLGGNKPGTESQGRGPREENSKPKNTPPPADDDDYQDDIPF